MKFKVVVKPNSVENHLLGYDNDRQAYIVRIKAPPQKGEANKELEKFLSKSLNKKVKIISGFKSHIKLVDIS